MVKVIGPMIISACILSSGCASFKANNLPVISDSDYNVSVPEKTKVFSRWSFDTTNIIVNKDAAAAVHKSAFEKAIQESGCCDIVEGPTEASVIIDGVVTDQSNSAALIPAMITGFSLYAIPSWVTETVDLKVNVEAKNKQSNYALNDSFMLVQWLPMVFAFPFTGGPIENGEELTSNTYRNLVVQLRDDKYL